MPTFLNISGTRFNRPITYSELASIQNAKRIDDVNTFWGKVADWFCGTDKESAKKAIFNLYQEDDALKLSSFFTLHNLATRPYKINFDFELNGDNIEIKITPESGKNKFYANVKPYIGSTTELTKMINSDKKDATKEIKQLKTDIYRDNYIFTNENGNTIVYHRDNGIKIDEKMIYIEKLIKDMNDFQKTMVGYLGSQSLSSAIQRLNEKYRFDNFHRNSEYHIIIFPSGSIKINVSLKSELPSLKINKAQTNHETHEIYEQNKWPKKFEYSSSFIIGKESYICLDFKCKYDDPLTPKTSSEVTPLITSYV